MQVEADYKNIVRCRQFDRKAISFFSKLPGRDPAKAGRTLRGRRDGRRTGDNLDSTRWRGDTGNMATVELTAEAAAKLKGNGVAAKRVVVKGKRMVMIVEFEFERLLRKADEFEPMLPAPLPNGNYPAGEYLRVSLALKIIRHRRRLGITQAELARRAGIRPASLNRIEQGQVDPSIRTVDKIERALTEAEVG